MRYNYIFALFVWVGYLQAFECYDRKPQSCSVERYPLGLEQNPPLCILDTTNRCSANMSCKAISTKDFCARLVTGRDFIPLFRAPSAEECVGDEPIPNMLRAELCSWDGNKCVAKNSAIELHQFNPQVGDSKPLGQICAEGENPYECFNFSEPSLLIPQTNAEATDVYLAAQRALFCAPSLRKAKNAMPVTSDILQSFQQCKSDKDCMFANNGCCDCANGGQEVSIRRDLLGAFNDLFLCNNVICTGKGREPPCGTGENRCEKNQCVFRLGQKF